MAVCVSRREVLGRSALKRFRRLAIITSATTVYSERIKRTSVILFSGAVRFEQAGKMLFTMDAGEAVQAAQAFELATVIPAHYEKAGRIIRNREVRLKKLLLMPE